MAGCTVIHDASVIKGGRQKTSSLVALATVPVCRDVLGMFTCRRYAIVTGGTVIYHAGVIKAGADKRRGVMAHRAILRSKNMGQ